jgi:hypothetical protein
MDFTDVDWIKNFEIEKISWISLMGSIIKLKNETEQRMRYNCSQRHAMLLVLEMEEGV